MEAYKKAVKRADPLPAFPQRSDYQLDKASGVSAQKIEALKEELLALEKNPLSQVAEQKIKTIENIHTLIKQYTSAHQDGQKLQLQEHRNNMVYLGALNTRLEDYEGYLTNGGRKPALPERSNYDLPKVPSDIRLNKIEIEKKKLLIDEVEMQETLSKHVETKQSQEESI